MSGIVGKNSGRGSGIVGTAALGADAVGLAEMAGGTDGNIISYDASGDPVAIATGDDGQVLTSTGAGSAPAFEDAGGGGLTLASEQATTSGSGVTFGSIPTGTKLIIVSFIGVSTDSGANLYVKLGDSGGLESSGYLSTASRLETSVAISTNNATAAFCINNSATGHTIHGSMTLTLEDSSGFTWASTHSTFLLTTMSSSGGGTKSLSAELTQVQVLPASGNFDAGAVNIAYL